MHLGRYDALMPTVNPRITITLKPEVHAILKRLSAATDNSQSAIVSELLESSVPVFERMVLVLEAAKAAQQGMASDIAQGLERAQSKIETQLGLMLGELDDAYRPILQQGEAVQRRRRKTAAAGTDALGAAGSADAGSVAPGGSTPMSNRGVRSGQVKVRRGS
jgi:predicted DNA-binding protein